MPALLISTSMRPHSARVSSTKRRASSGRDRSPATASVRSGTPSAVRVAPDPYAVQTPLMMKTVDGLYLNIHEAALVNYAAMQLHVNAKTFFSGSHLTANDDEQILQFLSSSKASYCCINGLFSSSSVLLASKLAYVQHSIDSQRRSEVLSASLRVRPCS